MSISFGRISCSVLIWPLPSTVAPIFRLYKALLPRIRDLLKFLDIEFFKSRSVNFMRSFRHTCCSIVIRVPCILLCHHELQIKLICVGVCNACSVQSHACLSSSAPTANSSLSKCVIPYIKQMFM
jgi:hypothetical protein